MPSREAAKECSPQPALSLSKGRERGSSARTASQPWRGERNQSNPRYFSRHSPRYFLEDTTNSPKRSLPMIPSLLRNIFRDRLSAPFPNSGNFLSIPHRPQIYPIPLIPHRIYFCKNVTVPHYFMI